MPFSYQAFGITAILIMIGILVIGQAISYLRDKHHHRSHLK